MSEPFFSKEDKSHLKGMVILAVVVSLLANIGGDWKYGLIPGFIYGYIMLFLLFVVYIISRKTYHKIKKLVKK